MHLSSYLDFAGAFLAYCLRIGAAFLLCLLLVRLLRRPQHRFAAWMSFLLFSAGYWVFLLAETVTGALPDPAHPAKPLPVRFVPAASHWFVPKGWAHPLAEGVVLLACLYSGLVLLLLGWRAIAHLRLRSLLRLGEPPSPQLSALVQSLAQDFGIRRCDVLVLPGITSPATVYWWKPCILLPSICEELGPSREVADVVSHELAHVVRRDYLLSSVTDAICTALFFHPAAWYARTQMRLQRELACDQAVVDKCPEHRADYADTLARFMRLRIIEPGEAVGIDFSGAPSVLGTRIRSILHEPGDIPRWKTLSRVAVGLLLLTGFAVTAPALSVLLDVRNDAAQPAATDTSRSSVAGGTTRGSRHSGPRHHSGRPASAPSSSSPGYELPDDLTSQRVHDRVAESDFDGVVPKTAGGSNSDELGFDRPAWRDSGPSSVGQGPTVRGIVIAAIGGIASVGGNEHEHAGHGHHVGR